MDQTENQERGKLKLTDLQDFEIGKIRDQTGIQLFDTFGDDEEKLKEFTDQFDDIYYLSVHPNDIDIYKDNPAISNILKRYEHTSEGRRLEIMIFKLKEISEEQKQETLKKLKEMYPGLNVKLDETKYQYIVGYFGGTAGRTNSAYMEEIRKVYPVKTLIN